MTGDSTPAEGSVMPSEEGRGVERRSPYDCVGCDGFPVVGNDPCEVCGASSARPTPDKALMRDDAVEDTERSAFVRLLDAADRFNGVYSCSDRLAAPYQGQMILAVQNAYRVLGIGRTKPQKPLTTPTPVEPVRDAAVEVLRRIVNTESLQEVQPVPRDPQEVAAFLSREIGAIRSLAKSALAETNAPPTTAADDEARAEALVAALEKLSDAAEAVASAENIGSMDEAILQANAALSALRPQAPSDGEKG